MRGLCMICRVYFVHAIRGLSVYFLQDTMQTAGHSHSIILIETGKHQLDDYYEVPFYHPFLDNAPIG